MLTAETLQKLTELCAVKIHQTSGGDEYVIHNGNALMIRPPIDHASTLKLNSLDALVQLIRTEAIGFFNSHIFIEASSPTHVKCFLSPLPELRDERLVIYEVDATDIPGWNGNDGIGFEEALIAIRTRFQQTTDTDYMLKLLSEISNGAKVTFSDNGIATTVVTKKGIDLQNNEAIRPIISLAPYRTFQEIEQPTSQFHIRISERGIRFIEADGGMWKLTARKTIAEYLKSNLSDEINNKCVSVIL